MRVTYIMPTKGQVGLSTRTGPTAASLALSLRIGTGNGHKTVAYLLQALDWHIANVEAGNRPEPHGLEIVREIHDRMAGRSQQIIDITKHNDDDALKRYTADELRAIVARLDAIPADSNVISEPETT